MNLSTTVSGSPLELPTSAVWPHLRPGGLLVADDVEGNSAFLELTRKSGVAFSTTIQEEAKKSLFGVAVKHN